MRKIQEFKLSFQFTNPSYADVELPERGKVLAFVCKPRPVIFVESAENYFSTWRTFVLVGSEIPFVSRNGKRLAYIGTDNSKLVALHLYEEVDF